MGFASHGVLRIPTLGRKSANGKNARDAHHAHRPHRRQQRRQHSASHGVVRIPTLGRKSANGETARDAHLAHRPRQHRPWHHLQRLLQLQQWHQLPPRPPRPRRLQLLAFTQYTLINIAIPGMVHTELESLILFKKDLLGRVGTNGQMPVSMFKKMKQMPKAVGQIVTPMQIVLPLTTAKQTASASYTTFVQCLPCKTSRRPPTSSTTA